MITQPKVITASGKLDWIETFFAAAGSSKAPGTEIILISFSANALLQPFKRPSTISLLNSLFTIIIRKYNFVLTHGGEFLRTDEF